MQTLEGSSDLGIRPHCNTLYVRHTGNSSGTSSTRASTFFHFDALRRDLANISTVLSRRPQPQNFQRGRFRWGLCSLCG